MKSWLVRSTTLVAFACLAGVVAACDENLEGGLGCGVLCPEIPAPVRQDTLFGVQLDTTIGGFPPTGAEVQLLLAARADTFDARVVLRFDSLPTTFRRPNAPSDSTILGVDSATVRLRVAKADTLGRALTLELYDVDVAAGDDTAAATLVPQFQPSRLLGSRTFEAKELKDWLHIPVDTGKLMEKIRSGAAVPRLRVGVRLAGGGSSELRVFASNGGFFPQLYFRASPDSAVPAVQLVVHSKTPANPTVAADLADFQLIAKAPPAPPANVLRIGGLPGSRAYMRFDIPRRIIDSSSIVRAQLLLTQRPNREGAGARDTAAVQPFALSAGGAIKDLDRVLLFLAAGFDSTRMVPADSGLRAFEIIRIVRGWRGTSPDRTPRAIALLATTEGMNAWQVDFYSIEAPAAVRPRLVVTYVPSPTPRIP